MRLAVVTSHPIQYYAPLLRELAKRIDLHVFFAHNPGAAEQARAGFGTAFEWDVDLTSGYEHTFLANVARRPGTDHFAGCDTPDIGKRLVLGKFDAVLSLGWHLKAYLQALYAAKLQGLPVLVRGDSHLETPRSALKRFGKSLAYPPFLRLFDAALYVGERSRAYYAHYGYPPALLFFSPHCVDNRWFAERATDEARNELRARLGVAPATTLCLFAGKLVPFKRPLDLVAAAARLRCEGRGIEIVVAGDGELRGQMMHEADVSGVPLHMLGFFNQTQMPAAYAAADHLVLPSDGRETWGLVANEALASGRPVIVSDACGCAPDLAADGCAGRTFASGDVAALAEAIDALATSPPPVAAIGYVSARFSLSSAADGIEAALAHLRMPRH